MAARKFLYAVLVLLTLFYIRSEAISGTIVQPEPLVDYTARNVSVILDSILNASRYDKAMRPGMGGPPLIIKAEMNVRSLGPVSETKNIYQFDCYFRQAWLDKRLDFSNKFNETLSVSIKILHKIWKPDTYFLNGRKSTIHAITTPNKFLRISPNGSIQYSMRVTVEAACPMILARFPLDTQICPFEFGSYAYTTEDVVYVWSKGNNASVVKAKGLLMSQYDLSYISCQNTTEPSKSLGLNSAARFQSSKLIVNFYLKRHIGFYLLEMYVPCSLIVVMSFISFWLDKDASAGRVSLGVLTVLTLTTLGFVGRSGLPMNAGVTALDWFVVLCFTFVFLSLAEYACVSFSEQDTGGEWKKQLKERDVFWEQVQCPPETQAIIQNEENHELMTEDEFGGMGISSNHVEGSHLRKFRHRHRHRHRQYEHGYDNHDNDDEPIHRSWFNRLTSRLPGGETENPPFPKRPKMTRPKRYENFLDKVSRFLFPICFAIANVFYWFFYLQEDIVFS